MLYDLDRPMNLCNRQILFLRLVRGTREILQRLLFEQLSFLISSVGIGLALIMSSVKR
jgi:hypothetical protein